MVLLIVLVGTVMGFGNDDYILLAEDPNICSECYEGSCVSQGKWNEQLQGHINRKNLI